jgi:hypothetical protein
MRMIHDHIKVASNSSTDALATYPNLVSVKTQTRKRIFETLFARANVEQRTHYHVATYTSVAL